MSLHNVRVLMSVVMATVFLAVSAIGPQGRAAPVQAAPAAAPARSAFAPTPTAQNLLRETESNNTFATANALPSRDLVVRGDIYRAGDLDFFSLSLRPGDRFYAATMTTASPASQDTLLTLLAPDGTTVVEMDDDDGSFAGLSSTIAGTSIITAGTYFLKVEGFNNGLVRPYDLHVKVQSGAPVAETEPNTLPTPEALPASGWVSGVVSGTATVADNDAFTFSLLPGDTAYLSLDLDPERNGSWNGVLGLAAFNNFILTINDSNTNSLPNSEAYFMTVKDAGTYYAYVGPASGNGTAASTYHLSVSIHRAQVQECTTYVSTAPAQPIGPAAGSVTSQITIPTSQTIADLNLTIALTHSLMADLDTYLTAPGGNNVALFTDIGSGTANTAGTIDMDLGLDDEAGISIGSYAIVKGMVVQPESAGRLSWFDGQEASGTWTLTVADDTAANGGTLQGWSITACGPPPTLSCPTTITHYANDFEATDGGFTHSGTADSWAWGAPTAAPLNTAHSGVNVWKTNLTGTYGANANFDLFSPALDLTSAVGAVEASWYQRYQMDTASNDHLVIDVVPVTGTTSLRTLFDFRDGVMTTTIGATTLQQSTGWGLFTADLSAFAGQQVRLRYHLDSGASVQLAGLAIDDVNVKSCSAQPTETPTPTGTPPTATPTDTPTNTPTGTPPTATPTDTPTDTPTNTPTNTPTDTPTNTSTPTNTPTNTPGTPTATPDPSCTLAEGFDAITTLPGAGWSLQNLSQPLGTTGWFQGNPAVFPAHTGAISTSYIGANFRNTAGAGTIDNWLISPVQNLANGSTLKFWTRIPDGEEFPDRLEIRMSTAGASTDTAGFTTLLLSINPNLEPDVYPKVWTEFTATVSGLSAPTSGRLAFRYFVTDGGPTGNNSNYIGIDTVSYCAGSGGTPTPTGGTPTATATPVTPTATATPVTPTATTTPPAPKLYLPLISK